MGEGWKVMAADKHPDSGVLLQLPLHEVTPAPLLSATPGAVSYLHNLRGGGLSFCKQHLGMLSSVVTFQLFLSGEELSTQSTSESALCLLEVLSSDVLLQGPWEAEGG